jgi:hypothetical protein
MSAIVKYLRPYRYINCLGVKIQLHNTHIVTHKHYTYMINSHIGIHKTQLTH